MAIQSGNAAKYVAVLVRLMMPILLFGAMSHAQTDATIEKETDPQVLKKLEWFQDQKFGLLMHWGTYSQWQIVESWSICPEDENWCKRRGERTPRTTIDTRRTTRT